MALRSSFAKSVRLVKHPRNASWQTHLKAILLTVLAVNPGCAGSGEFYPKTRLRWPNFPVFS
jgi:hypothetical protein